MQLLKRITLIVFITLAGIFLLGSLLAIIYKDKVTRLVVASLNKNLTAKITVDEISFSFFKAFPYASVDFKNIKAAEAANLVTTGTVMNAEQLRLLFNLRSIFSDNYQLKKIVLSNASLNLQVALDGKTNYHIWKTDSTSGNIFQLELQQVEFENVNVLYYNVAKQQDFSFHINTGTLQGDFANDKYSLNTEGSLENTSIIIDKINYLSGTNCDLKLSLDVNRETGIYTFRNSSLKLAKLALALNGTVTDKEKYMDLDLEVTSSSADLPALISLLPAKYISGTTDYNYSGNVEFIGKFSGRSDATHSPLVTINFVSKNAYLNPKNTAYKLKNLNGKGYFTNRKNKANPVTYLKLENFSATLEGKPVKANVEIENFNHPRLNINTSFEANLEAMSKFFKPDTLESISGIAIVDATFNGISGQKSTYRSSGNVRFENVNFRIKQKPVAFKNISGLMHLQGNDVLIEKLEGTAGMSDFSVSGSFKNLFSWLMNDNQPLYISASLNSKTINLDELMATDHNANHANDTIYRIIFPEELKVNLSLDLAHLQFRKFTADNIQGEVILDHQQLSTNEINFNSVDGNVRLQGSIDDHGRDSLQIKCNALLTNLNINRLFYEMENFGQAVIMDKNLKGKLTAQIGFRSTWSNNLEVNGNSIYMKSDVKIENGELINLNSLLALSKYLKGADLKTVKFSTLTNTIEIRNRKIYIPLMEIKSSAIDITASGDHTFDNIVDYKLQLYLSQIMGKKVKAQNTEFGTIEDDGLGRTMIYLTMKGPATDPKFTWDRKSVEQKISTEISKESKTFKNLIKEEFSKKDPVTERPSARKKTDELELEYEEDAESN